MGRGIAQLAATHGALVVAIPGRRSAEGVESAKARFAKDRSRAERRGMTDAESVFARIRVTDDLHALSECTLVIESVIEDLPTKKALLQEVEGHLTEGAILATNTSSLPLSALSAVLKRPAQFLALHFFNPPARMELVEIGLTADTAPGVAESARTFCRELGRTPVDVQASPGYVVNRLLVPQLLHAIATLESGIADVDAIDTAMKLGLSHPMGPLALADYIGLDVVFAMAQAMRKELDDTRFDVPPLLEKLVQAETLGRKSGRGFYDYGGDQPTACAFK